jgi:hypothetical protein
MRRVRVLHDDSSAVLATKVVDQVRTVANLAEPRNVTRFPTGDALPALLNFESARFDLLVVVIADDSPNRAWIVNELRLGHLYPTVLIAVGLPAGLPDWQPHHPERAFVVGEPLPSLLAYRGPTSC